MSKGPCIWKEHGIGHPYCVHVDGQEYGWLANHPDAEALARKFRDAGHDATTAHPSRDEPSTFPVLRIPRSLEAWVIAAYQVRSNVPIQAELT
jgi:hypothetical protein